MEEVVLDSSVIVKAILKPYNLLSDRIYKRELETHRKARLLIKKLKMQLVRVLIPYPVLVEVAAVITRLSNRELAEKVIDSLLTTKNYVIVYEEEYRDKALEVALRTGSSGFDAYIIALSQTRNALLITDDEPMSRHAKEMGVSVVLLRNLSLEDINRLSLNLNSSP